MDGDYAGTSYACPDGRCPSGFECVEQRCVAPGVTDGAPSDGTPEPDGPPGPDASCACDSASFADSCAGGELVTLEEVRAPGGETVCATTALNSKDFFGCEFAPMPEKDAVFRIALSAGERLSAELRPEGFDGAIYVLSSCPSECLALSDDEGIGGTEALEWDASESKDHYLVVDSGSGAGCYQLHVTVE